MKTKKRVAKQRTDKQLLDALESYPWRMEIIYKVGEPKSDSVPSLRSQINYFIDLQQ